MTLYLCTKTVTISSRGPPNLSNFLCERQSDAVRDNVGKHSCYNLLYFVNLVDE